MQKRTKDGSPPVNPLFSKNIPPPPAQEALPSVPIVREHSSPLPVVERVAPTAEKREVKVSVVMNESQADKIAALKMQYYDMHHKWLSDTEVIRRLVESATINAILTPSSQKREKAR